MSSACRIGWPSGQLVRSSPLFIACIPEYLAGYRASIIDYAHKIEELFAKMENIHAAALPLNRQSVVKYLADLWKPVHTMISPILLLQPAHNDLEKFKPYLEAEEARLERNLSTVGYVIDSTDTLALITGVGRIEKVST
jgi:hypothetical protein